MRLQSMDMKGLQEREWMMNKVKTMVSIMMLQEGSSQQSDVRQTWVVDVLLPSLFTMLLLGCLIHLGYCALKSQLEPVVRFHYAISAFPV